MKLRIGLGIVAIALAGGFAWWFQRNFEPITERIWVGFSGEAARDRFMAAELFLVRMGVEVSLGRSAARLGDLDKARVAVVPARRQSLVPGEVDTLVRWVAAGGHLIVQAEAPGTEDPLLSGLGMRTHDDHAAVAQDRSRRSGKADRNARAPGEAQADDAGQTEDPKLMRRQERLADIMLPGATEPVIVRIRSPIAFADDARPPDYQWRDAHDRIHLASFRVERGRVTVLGSMPFINALIDAHDHAGLLFHLAHWDTNSPVVRFFDWGGRRALWRWLLEQLPYAAIALALAIAAWVWRVSIRFGPITPDPAPARRRLLDHLAASGRFQWRRAQTEELARAAHDQAFELVRRVSPGFDRLPPEHQRERLRALVKFTEEEALAALEPRSSAAREFMNRMHLYQRIHAALRRRLIEPSREAPV